MAAGTLLALGMPIAMAVSGVVAWRASKKDSTKPETPAWRDDSLDDWRKERDRQAEQERQTRPKDQLKTGSEREEESTQRQQRLG